MKYSNAVQNNWTGLILPQPKRAGGFFNRQPKGLNILVVVALLVSTFATLSVVEPVAVTHAAGLNSANLVVLRVGDGGASLSSAATAVFLDEITTNGSKVQSLGLPTAVSGNNRILTESGSASSEGALTRSADGKYLSLVGYDAAPGTASVVSTASATTNRIVARVDGSGNIDTSTRISDAYTGNNIRAAVTDDGSRFWTTGPGQGIRLVSFGNTGTTTAINSLNTRVPAIFNRQLYVSSSSGSNIGVNSVGTGLPTASTAVTLLPGVTTATNAYAYLLLDRDPGVAGPDTLYVADQANGLLKFSFDGTTWTSRNKLAGNLTGLTGTVNADNSVSIFATSGTSAGNNLVSYTDTAAFNQDLASGSFATIATAPANTVFRGLAFAPEGATGGDSAPSITTNPASQTISSGQTATMTVAATSTLPLTYQWYQGTSGDTSNPIAGATNNTFTTPALTVTTSYWVQVANSAGPANSNTATITVNSPVTCGGDFTHTYQIQGTTNTSPLSGQTVTVQGVVVADDEGPSPALRGFYIQDETGDGNPATSDGLFVFNGNNNSVSAGQVVRVTGVVSEYQGLTEVTASTIDSCNRTATITPTDVTLPFSSADFPERYEGMLVRLSQQLFVTESYQLGRFDQLTLSSGSRLRQPTELADPGAPAQAIQAANDLNQIIIDDNLQNQNPDPIIFGGGTSPLTASNTVRIGDSATGIVGVLDYTWAGNSASPNAYRVRPTIQPNFVPTNPRPTVPDKAPGSLRVVGANLLNYFNTFSGCTYGVGGAPADCRGAESQTEFDRQSAKTVAALTSSQADVIAFSEIENNGYGPNSAIVDLVTRLNAKAGAGTWAFIDADANTGQVNSLGLDAIKVGILYKPAKVNPIGKTAVLNTGALGLFQLADGSVQGRSRPAIAQSFEQNSNGESFTVVANHLKSKGSACTDNVSPVGPDPDTGDLQGNCNLTRTQAAKEETAWLATNPTGISDPDVLIMGDMNAYAKEDPIKAFEQAGYINLIAKYLGNDAYSYVFDGQSGYLDHALVSSSLAGQIASLLEYHNNADEPTVLDYNTNYKSANQITSLYAPDQFRASDHDPVVVDLNLHPQTQANDDTYTAEAGTTLNVNAANGVLANDKGGSLSVTSQTAPANGTLNLNADGSFTYTPKAGFTGTDSFVYTTTNSVQLYKTNLPPYATIGGVDIKGGAYGSSLYPVPGSSDEYYGLTDRGPNVDGPNGVKVEPIPDFAPAIGKFKLVNGKAILEQVIPLKSADGTPYNGLVSTEATTGETIVDLNGNILPPSPTGYDPEGLVALPDGTFWVSDEYGPYITHFDASGKQIGRLSPFDNTLPAELKFRVPNRGMEGLTITPDGTTLVGAMQSALQQSDLAGYDAKKLTVLRIVTYSLVNGQVHEYLYLLDNPNTNKTAVSEIAALSNTSFILLERDGNYPPNSYKQLWKIDLTGATDVGPASTVPGATYNAANGGLLINGKSLELLVKGQDTATSAATLAGVGIKPGTKSLYLDIVGLLDSIDSTGAFFSHDKIEGVAVLDGGNKLVLSNDNDFGIDGLANSTTPYQLHAKVSPVTGQQDDGEYLMVDLTKLPATVSSAKVTINVVDTIAPTTSDNAPADWQKANFNVTLTCADSGSGCKETDYRLDGGAWKTGTTVAITTEGDHLLEYYSVDQAGNKETIKAVHVKLDKTAPEFDLSFDRATSTLKLGTVDSLSGPGADPLTLATGIGERTYTLKDKAGNSLAVTLLINNPGRGHAEVVFTKLVYTTAAGSSTIRVPLNLYIAEWFGRPRDKAIQQDFAVLLKYAVDLEYNSNRDKTDIAQTGSKKQTLNGFYVLHVQSSKGSLIYNYKL
ncbi:MAG: hypothetical protein BGO39_36680 [Chloroflexi bacterium 54-19]|nr:MAG: hypothetical protein BGO39_36680 [Chloroflexi bacterium 54-19]